MHTSTEGDMTVGGPSKIDVYGVRTTLEIGVGGAQMTEDLFTLFHEHPTDVHVGRCSTAEGRCRCFDAQKFLDRRRHDVRIVDDAFALLGVSCQIGERARQSGGHGVEASHDEQVGDIEDLLDCQTGVHHLAQQVIARSGASSDQRGHVPVELRRRALPEIGIGKRTADHLVLPPQKCWPVVQR